jgi:hypothetical protein
MRLSPRAKCVDRIMPAGGDLRTNSIGSGHGYRSPQSVTGPNPHGETNSRVRIVPGERRGVLVGPIQDWADTQFLEIRDTGGKFKSRRNSKEQA